MTTRRLLLDSIRHYWRTHLGVILGSALAALVLTGALMVGDSVKATLRAQAEARVGLAEMAMTSGERFFSESLGYGEQSRGVGIMPAVWSAPVLMLRATVARADGGARVNAAQLLGVQTLFWKQSPGHAQVEIPTDGVALNSRLAAQLGVTLGDTLNIRVEKPGVFSRDAPLSGSEDKVVVLRVKFARELKDEEFGRFALNASQVPPFTACVPLADLQKKLGLPGKANLLLVTQLREERSRRPRTLSGVWDFFRGFVQPRQSSADVEKIRMRRQAGLFESLGIGDLALEVREMKDHSIELRTPRVFLDPSVVAAAPRGKDDRRVDALTYFVNELRAGEKATPYSMITAIDAPASGFVNPNLADDEIQITRWLADDLGVAPGAKLTAKYFVMGERRQITEVSHTFTVATPILEMDTPQLDTSWMPDFPNVPDEDSFGKWKPGFDFDATRIRKKDEEYWKKYRGTPKAFVTLKAGQELWGNRWGNVTSMRWPAATERTGNERRDIERELRAKLSPEKLGFQFIPLREQALAATNAPVDFGELFVYFSFFLIAAAAVLTGLLFTFTIEQRAAEAGLLLAVGWPVKKVRRLFLREGFVLAFIGSLAGALLAALYTKGVLHALAGVWGGATGGTRFVFAPSAVTMAIGVVSGVLVAIFAMWLASRRLFKMEAAQLLSGTGQQDGTVTKKAKRSPKPPPFPMSILYIWPYLFWGFVVLTSAVSIVKKAQSPILFFVLGFALLLAGIFVSNRILRRAAVGTGAETIAQLGARNISRRRGRSLATIAVLASGVFMVIAVDSFRKGAPEDSARRDSGTGGFAFIGESSAPIYEDLNSAKGRDAYALDDKLMAGVHVVQMRVRDGDDASCLNLNKALQPRVLGVRPSELNDPLRFKFYSVHGVEARWWVKLTLLVSQVEPEIRLIPAMVDANTLQWALKMKIGDTLPITDERGEERGLRVVDSFAASILQGQVLISEGNFVRLFPNTAGYRFFLVDCPREKMDAVREHLTRQLGDRGLELTPAVKRLAEFNEVENTYLSIFQVLGGLGMLLGSAGLGIVVARNVFERRREFGLLEAVGFTPQTLRRLVFAEHRWLIIGALGIGAISALTAVWPRLSAQAAHFPWRGILTLLAGMALLGAFWAWLATRIALRRSQLTALRTE